MHKDIKDFDFYTFLQDITNQSIDPLQGNERFNDLVRGMESVFNKLYKRVQEIGISNTLNSESDRDFTKYLPGNAKVIDTLTGASVPYKDIILDQLSQYLDTDHFKDTVSMMMRLWQKREANGGLIGENDSTIDTFLEQHIIPSFRFFTSDAGNLHKSKGVAFLLNRLFEFYSQVDTNDISFDGIVEHDNRDDTGRRFRQHSSLREGITLGSLLNNYSDIAMFQNVNYKITQYYELEIHKFVLAGPYLFMSRKDREDWHIINMVDEIFRLNNHYLVIRKSRTLTVYSDNINLYDPITNEVIIPNIVPDFTINNVNFIPKIINIEDKFNQYHDNNLYFIEVIRVASSGFGKYEYNLKRIRHDISLDSLRVETIKLKMGLTYLPLHEYHLADEVYPRITSIVSVDYLWLNFYDPKTTENFEFFPNVIYPTSLEPVKFVYSFVINEKTQVADPAVDGGLSYPTGKYICISRDGYNYDNANVEVKYLTVSNIDTINKYILQERNVSNFLQSELDEIIGDDITATTVLDLFNFKSTVIYQDPLFNEIGLWDASNSTKSPPSNSPNDKDYWVVSKRGNTELNGISTWEFGDIIVWNGRFGYWEKNNQIKELKSGLTTDYNVDHRLIVVGSKEFISDIGESSPYEQNCGLFVILLSSLKLNITNFYSIIWIDTNPVEKFGNNPTVLFSYIDKRTGRYMIYSVRMDGFFREHDSVDLNRVLKGFPVSSAKPIISKIEITDRHLIAYCDSFLNVNNSKSTAIICENTNYILPFGIRSSRANMSYNADIRLSTRENQPFFKEWTLENTKGIAPVNFMVYLIDQTRLIVKQYKKIENYYILDLTDGRSLKYLEADIVEIKPQISVTGGEVEAFRNTLDRYTPINVEREWLQENIDIGVSSQTIDADTIVEESTIDIPTYGSKIVKEISKLSMRDSLIFRTDGDPESPNCNCATMNPIIYIHDFKAMTLFYDFSSQALNGGLSKVPSCVPAILQGKAIDKYSGFADVCRWDTDWFYYQYDDGVTTIPRLVRSRFRINLFDRLQRVAILGASSPMVFNWSIHCLIEILVDDPLTTLPVEWITATNEEIFMPLKINGECNPLGTYYTSDNTVPPNTIVDPWEIYNIIATEASLVYNCNFVPWVPDISQFVRSSGLYPELPIVEEIPPERTNAPDRFVSIEIWRLNPWLEGYSVTGDLSDNGISYPVNIELLDGYIPDPLLGNDEYVTTTYNIVIGPGSTIPGLNLIYNTEAPYTEVQPAGRIKITFDGETIYDSGFKNGKIIISQNYDFSINAVPPVIPPIEEPPVDIPDNSMWPMLKISDPQVFDNWASSQSVTTIMDAITALMVYSGGLGSIILKSINWNGTSWTTKLEAQFSGISGYNSSITRLTDQKAMVALQSISYNTGSIKIVDWDGLSWRVADLMVHFEHANTTNISIDRISDESAIVSYTGGDGSEGKVCSIVWSGSTWIAGSSASVGQLIYKISLAHIVDQMSLIAYSDYANGSYGTFRTATLVGNTTSLGTPIVFAATECSHTSIARMTDTTALVAYVDVDDSSTGKVCLLTWNGSSWSAGTPIAISQHTGEITITRNTDKTATVAYSSLDEGGIGRTLNILNSDMYGWVTNLSHTFGTKNTTELAVTRLSNTSAVVVYGDDVLDNERQGTMNIIEADGI